MTRFFSALLVFPPVFLGLLGGVVSLVLPAVHSNYGPTFDLNQQNQCAAGFVLAVVTLWLWLNAFFKFTKTPVLDGLLALFVPVCVAIIMYLVKNLETFHYSGDDGWLVGLEFYVWGFFYALFAVGFVIILNQRYCAKKPR